MNQTPHPVRYQVLLQSPHAHLFQVTCILSHPNPNGQLFQLPSWILGSYLIRDFAKHIDNMQALCDQIPIPIEKIDKHTWRIAPCQKQVVLSYNVYGFDPSVRMAYLDQFSGFFNGTSLFVCPIGHEKSPYELSIIKGDAPYLQTWEIATTLTPHPNQTDTYQAANYEELVDCPVLMGNLSQYKYEATGVPHQLVLDKKRVGDFKRVCSDLEKICSYQIKLFGEPAPFSHYAFLTRVEEDGYGGLEHQSSSALICKPSDFPLPGEPTLSEHYRSFLGLCSHEYFHAWNVKRIRPLAFSQGSLTQEQYTTLLWVFEGITSYYDDLVLVRSGVISETSYLDLLSKSLSRVYQTPGRHNQTLAQSSFDTWVKFYKPDENTPNAQISYYQKGALVALALDLLIRTKTHHTKSLDDVMKALWQQYGKPSRGVGEADFESLAQAVSGLDLTGFFNQAIRGTEDLPLAELLKPFGIRMELKGEHAQLDLLKQTYTGMRLRKSDHDVTIQHVMMDSPAMHAGLSAGDILIAVDGRRVKPANVDQLLHRNLPNSTATVHAFRRGELFSVPLTFAKEPPLSCSLSVEDSTESDFYHRALWLGLSQVKPK